MEKRKNISILFENSKAVFDQGTDYGDPIIGQLKKYYQQVNAQVQHLKRSKSKKFDEFSFVYGLEVYLLWKYPKNLKSKIDKLENWEEHECSICWEALWSKQQMSRDGFFKQTFLQQNVNQIAVKLLRCKDHYFHLSCIRRHAKFTEPALFKCPVCKISYGQQYGPQPEGGQMQISTNPDKDCEGYPGCGTIEICYRFGGGWYTPPAPEGQRRQVQYQGFQNLMAYLPDTQEGFQVLELLKICFERRHTFKIGYDVVKNQNHCVTWNGVHHMLATSGGVMWNGYPDETYFVRVKADLKEKGITLNDIE